MWRILLFLTISAIANNVSGQLFNSGVCPTIPAMTGFDAAKFAGLWYPIRQYPTVYETIARCPTIKYTLAADGKYAIQQDQIMISNSAPMTWLGIGKFTDGPTVGKWNWNIPAVPIGIPNIEYMVLGTDYSSYAVVYSCVNVLSFHMKSLWIMTKSYPLLAPPTAVTNGIALIDKYGLDKTLLIPTVQLLCPLPSLSSLLNLPTFG